MIQQMIGKLFSAGSEQKLDNVIQYIDFWPNEYNLPIIFLKDGSMMLLFQLWGIDYESISREDQSQLSYYARCAIEQLGPGFTLSNYLVRSKLSLKQLKIQEQAPEVMKFIQEKKQQNWNQIAENSLTNHIFCSLRFYSAELQEKPLMKSIQRNGRLILLEELLAKNAKQLFQGYMDIKNLLNRFGFQELNQSQSYNILYYIINNQSAPVYRDDLSLNSQLAHASIEIHRDYAAVNQDNFINAITLKYSPPSTVPFYLRRFFDLPFEFVFKNTFEYVKFADLEKKLNFNQSIAQAISRIDRSSARYAQQVSMFIDKVKNDNEVALNWQPYIYIKGSDKQDLERKTFIVKGLFKELGSAGLNEKRNFKPAFFSMYPGHERFSPRKRSGLVGSHAGDLFNAYNLYNGVNEPAEYFLDRNNGVYSYSLFNPAEMPGHIAITGPTGSGKSFWANSILAASILSDNPDITVIDLSESFNPLFEFLRQEKPEETAIMKIDPEKVDFKFNPFMIQDLQNPVSEDQLNYCEGLLNIMIGESILHQGNRIVIRDSLVSFFKHYQRLLRNNIHQEAIPPLDILIPIVEEKTEEKEIINALRLWTRGSKGAMFNSGEDTLCSARYILYDLKEIERDKDILAAVVYTIFSKLSKNLNDPERKHIRKILFIDEVQRFLQIKAFSQMIDYFFSVGRHGNLLVGVITQGINRLITDDDWSEGLKQNLRQAVIFSGQKGIENSFRKLNMNNHHIAMYYKMRPERREFLYWGSSGLIRIFAPQTNPYSYWMNTTDPDERKYRSMICNLVCQGNMKKTIEMLVSITGGAMQKTERISRIKKYLDTNKEKSA